MIAINPSRTLPRDERDRSQYRQQFQAGQPSPINLNPKGTVVEIYRGRVSRLEYHGKESIITLARRAGYVSFDDFLREGRLNHVPSRGIVSLSRVFTQGTLLREIGSADIAHGSIWPSIKDRISGSVDSENKGMDPEVRLCRRKRAPIGYRIMDYADRYGVTKRTIIRWHKQGLPLDQPLELLKILGTRKHQPKGLKQLLGRLANNPEEKTV